MLLACGGPLRSAPAGEIEMVMPGPANACQVQFIDLVHGVTMGSVAKGHPGSAIAWTDDGGENWNDAAIECSLAERNAEALWLGEAHAGWALVYGGKPRRQALLKTEDGGKRWKEQPAAELAKAWSLGQIWLDRAGQRGWINSTGGALWKTTDGARSWQPVSVAKYAGGPLVAEGKPLSPNFGHPGIYVFSFEHLILCGQAGAILESTDAGHSWNAQQVPLQADAEQRMRGGLAAIHFTADGRAGWAVGGEGDLIRNPNGHTQLRSPVVLRSVDAGRTWQRCKLSVRGPLGDVWAISGQEAWLCGPGGYALQQPAPGTLRHTVDGGRTWVNEHPGRNALRKLFFLDARHGWVAGGTGGGVEAESLMLLIRP
jgi:photosystem II stability/assembly factor-like uncharacterized protein